jgi:hypothetical protein
MTPSPRRPRSPEVVELKDRDRRRPRRVPCYAEMGGQVGDYRRVITLGGRQFGA